jgi:hypothetical protein
MKYIVLIYSIDFLSRTFPDNFQNIPFLLISAIAVYFCIQKKSSSSRLLFILIFEQYLNFCSVGLS